MQRVMAICARMCRTPMVEPFQPLLAAWTSARHTRHSRLPWRSSRPGSNLNMRRHFKLCLLPNGSATPNSRLCLRRPQPTRRRRRNCEFKRSSLPKLRQWQQPSRRSLPKHKANCTGQWNLTKSPKRVLTVLSRPWPRRTRQLPLFTSRRSRTARGQGELRLLWQTNVRAAHSCSGRTRHWTLRTATWRSSALPGQLQTKHG
mmetsp:Transcript_6682/g.15889  ORF Transcript_6682/g.15889 Transcript_6682/m.15889 type:complete len:202 (+) Transcript_6682:1918-2523(+)